MTNEEIFAAAYREAAIFTECGDVDQPPSDAEFSKLALAQSYLGPRNFYWACKDLIGDHIEQAGHDLWFTRNGHGAGFWDRPELYGREAALTLTRCAKCLGEVWLYQGDDGLLYFTGE